MRIVLRLFALLLAAVVLLTAYYLFYMVRWGYLSPFVRSGALGATTLFAWALVLLLGPFAAVQLWRLRQSGRLAAIVLTLAAMAYYVIGAVFLRGPGASSGSLITAIGVNLALALVLLSPAARRACSPSRSLSS